MKTTTIQRLLATFLLFVTSLSVFSADAGGVSRQSVGEAQVVVFNRNVAVFRTPFLGNDPEIRAARARASIEDLLRRGGDLQVSVKPNPEGQLVMLGPQLALVLTPGDVDVLAQETLETTANEVARRLETVVTETREARDYGLLLRALAVSAVATLVFVALIGALRRFRRWVAERFLAIAERQAEALKISGRAVIESHTLLPYVQRAIDLVRWFVIALLTYEWASFVLSRFPYTRPWGEQLNHYLVRLLLTFAEAIANALPGLCVALAIFLIARFFSGAVGNLMTRLSEDNAESPWLNRETVPTTRRLTSIAIWLFAVAMAYPYLPGAQTEAFKGLSVLLGLMVSLGASSIVGQGAAGLILTYTRTIRPGEYVRVGDHEGTVVEMGMFTTRIRTGLGEELTLPNSTITGTVTKNYSRTVRGRGYVVDTTVTIGYDTPWRQVEAMLVEAAKRTPGILASPQPRVFQTALSDYYPEYRLVAQAVPTEPRPRAEVLTMLHANIQDVFNEYGVQIMSPHYMADPADAKVVAPENWHAAPAQKPDA